MGLQVRLNSAFALRCVVIAVPFAFGFWSVILGADTNWDLYNYHLYNAFTFLNGKVGIDLAPGGFQSYFNPLLDVPYFVALTHLPGPAVGFAMGALHGLNFLVLIVISRAVLQQLDPRDSYWIPIMLSMAGCLGASFLSELGNTMGDNTTSLLILASLAILLAGWERLTQADRHGAAIVLAAGVVAGFAVGLKLTNAIHAAALCVAFATFPAGRGVRVRLATLFVSGMVAGAALTGGYWHYEMWRTFGNPFFPQFGSIFPNELALPISVADTSWQPKGWLERFVWPLVISVDARRAGQLPLRQVIWAVVYAMFIAWAITAMLRRHARTSSPAMDARARYVVTTVGAGFTIWMSAFGVYRYLVPLELLAPLAVFILATHCFPRRGRRIAAWALSIAVFVVIAGGMKTWGHADWEDAPFGTDLPAPANPAATTVLLVGDDPPWSWIGVTLPRDVALAQVAGSFPEGPAFKPRLQSMVASRGGPAFAVVSAHHDTSAGRGRKAIRLIESLGLTRSETSCSMLRTMVQVLRLRFEVSNTDGGSCVMRPAMETRRDIEAENRIERERATRALERYGFALDEASCELHSANLAAEVRAFHWCRVRRAAESPAG